MDSNEILKRNQKFIEEISHMLIRWKAGSMVKHLDLDLFERVVHEVFELERHLVIAMNTIEVLSNKVRENDLILQHFTEEDLAFLRKRIEDREAAARMASDAEQHSLEEVHEVRNDREDL